MRVCVCGLRLTDSRDGLVLPQCIHSFALLPEMMDPTSLMEYGEQRCVCARVCVCVLVCACVSVV